jgi:hypothetical protein
MTTKNSLGGLVVEGRRGSGKKGEEEEENGRHQWVCLLGR